MVILTSHFSTLLCFYWERNENFKTLQLADFCDKNLFLIHSILLIFLIRHRRHTREKKNKPFFQFGK